MLRRIIIFTLFYVPSILVAQSNKIDSLRTLIKKQGDDTNKVNTVNALASIYRTFNPDSAIVAAQQALTLSNKINWPKGQAVAYNIIGRSNEMKGNFPKAIEYFQKALELTTNLDDKKLEADILCNVGITYDDQGDFINAIDYYSKGLKIGEELKDLKIQARNLGNIGILYYEQGDHPKTLDYFLRTLKCEEQLNDKPVLGSALGNIGNAYFEEGEYDSALVYDFKALKYAREFKDQFLEANVTGNIGSVYNNKGDTAKASLYVFQSLKLNEDIGAKQHQIINLDNIGEMYERRKEQAKALPYYQKALLLCDEIGAKTDKSNTICDLGSLYVTTGNYKEAEKDLKAAIGMDSNMGLMEGLERAESSMSDLCSLTGKTAEAFYWYRKAVNMRDSVFNMEKHKAFTQKELTYQFEKKQEVEKLEQDKKDAITAQDKHTQALIRNGFIGGFALMFALAFFIFRGYKQKQRSNVVITRQKEEVEHQKLVVEEKQKEILDSIQYARRIQNALLASDTLLKANLPEHFVLYKPKDIVSGDFYWATQKDNRFYLAVCDCTGHGVPGAFMSLLNITFLNEAIKEKDIADPAEVFNHTRRKLIEDMEGQQDGMDGLLVSLPVKQANVGQMLYSGAFNAPVVIRNGELLELESDKMPVGASPKENEKFTSHAASLQKGDTLYLFTDGYGDQFGGPKGKKFKHLQLLEKLRSVAALGMEKQKETLNTILEDWKGGLEQVDDILVVGIRV